MKIPNHINLAGKSVKVEFDKSLLSSGNRYGECEYQANIIRLAKQRDDIPDIQVIEQTFIHEVLHYMNNILGKQNDDVDGEDYVQSLSELLYQFIQQIKD
jgi:hypothetical protein